MTEWRDLEPSSVLVVDDDEGVLVTIARFLEREGYSVIQARNLTEARQALDSHDILVVLADIVMPGESGLDLLSEIRREHTELDVMMMTANTDLDSAVEALKQGAYDYLTKPFPFEMLAAAVRRAVERRRLAAKAALLAQLEERRHADAENLEEFLLAMATVIDAKSRYTARHSARVGELARLLAEAMGLDEPRVARITLGGRLHDIGKIGVADAIIDKQGPLTRDEFAEMMRHPVIGDDLIAPIRTMQELRPMIRWHHERLDGTGYPDGLPGDEVPLEAWIVKVADFWEAITSRRPYREPMPLDLAVKTLRSEAGSRIPADVVETFLKAIEDAPIALPAAATA